MRWESREDVALDDEAGFVDPPHSRLRIENCVRLPCPRLRSQPVKAVAVHQIRVISLGGLKHDFAEALDVQRIVRWEAQPLTACFIGHHIGGLVARLCSQAPCGFDLQVVLHRREAARDQHILVLVIAADDDFARARLHVESRKAGVQHFRTVVNGDDVGNHLHPYEPGVWPAKFHTWELFVDGLLDTRPHLGCVIVAR